MCFPLSVVKFNMHWLKVPKTPVKVIGEKLWNKGLGKAFHTFDVYLSKFGAGTHQVGCG